MKATRGWSIVCSNRCKTTSANLLARLRICLIGGNPGRPDRAKDPPGGFLAPHAILEDLQKRVPKYLADTDQGRLIYPACKRTLGRCGRGRRPRLGSHPAGGAALFDRGARGTSFELLSEPARQIEMIDAYLAQRPHGDTVIDFTGTAPADFRHRHFGRPQLADPLRAARRRRSRAAIPAPSFISESSSRWRSDGG